MPNDNAAPPAAPPGGTGTALTVQQRASLALGAPEHEKKLVDLAKQATEIVAIKDKVTYDQCHGTRMSLKRARISIEQTGKTAREDAQAFSKAVIAEEKRLIGIIEPEETRLQGIQDAHDAEVERRKAAAAQAERERVERIQASIRDIRGSLIDVAGRSAAVIEAKIKELVAVEITTENAQEFQQEAESTREATLAKLREMLEAQQRAETEAAQIKAERAELERRQAEQVERERDAAARAEAEQRRVAEAEAERLRAIKAEEDAARARIEAQEREARERREAADRELAAERERIAAAARDLEERQRAEREAAEARDRDARLAQEEADRLERLAREDQEREQREARELADRQERERVEAENRQRETADREAREAEEAESREKLRLQNELIDGTDMLIKFKERFGKRTEFAGVVKAIDAYLTPKTPRVPKPAKAAAL